MMRGEIAQTADWAGKVSVIFQSETKMPDMPRGVFRLFHATLHQTIKYFVILTIWHVIQNELNAFIQIPAFLEGYTVKA